MIPNAKRPLVVIVGAGFGGITAARALARSEVDILLIDRINHHVFQPLLYQTATAALAPSDIASPVRAILRRNRKTTVIMGEVIALMPTACALTASAKGAPWSAETGAA